MNTLIITGPSCSGKTILSNKLCNYFSNTIVIKTDSYYRDDLWIKLLSLFKYDIYDRFISIKDKELVKAINCIQNKEKIINFYNYDFRRKISSKDTRTFNYEKEFRFLILEGIFSHRLDINYNKTINIVCNEKKDVCYERRLKRDILYRGRSVKEVNRKFSRSWNLYYENFFKYTKNNSIITLNPADNILYTDLINKLNKIS